MITRIGTIAAVACGLTIVAHADRGYRLQDVTTVRHMLRFAGGGERTVVVRNLHGSIRVSGQRGDDVRLEATRTVSADTPDDLARGEREAVLSVADGRPTIEAIVREPNGPVCGEQWEGGWQRRPRYHVRYDFELAVPERTRLVLCTINGEAIDVDGTSGDFDISNVNGRITMARVRGSGRAHTVNGPITATFLDVPRTDADFKTINGELTMTWPAALTGRLRLKTFNGGLFTDFDVEPLARKPLPLPSSSGGRTHYRSNQYTEVQVGRGGPEITLESFNGNVRVLRGSR